MPVIILKFDPKVVLTFDLDTSLEKLVVMALSPDRKKALRTIGHKLNPVVIVAGNGLNENVLIEINRALEDHELIKVKYSVGDRELKQELIELTLKSCRATLVQGIGNIALLYRAAKEPDPKKSNLLR